MNLHTLVLLSLCLHATYARVLPRQVSQEHDSIAQDSTLVVFGDSYSDDCNLWRLNAAPDLSGPYQFPHCPPPGVDGAARSTGGYIWPEFLRNGSNVNILNFAHSGATCSNALYPRNTTDPYGAPVPLPAVDEQISLFQKHNATFTEATLYTALIFIGTNDLGTYFSGMQYGTSPELVSNAVTIQDEANCVAQQVQKLLELGVQKVVVLNITPLQRTALFSHDVVQGFGAMVTQNGAATAELMEQLVIASNLIQQTSLQQLNSTFLAAGGTQQLSIYDTYALFDNLLNNPPESAYGPSPNTADFCDECAGSTGACSPCQNPQSYFYQDQLHPSQTTSALLAENLAAYLGLSYTNPLAT